MCRGQSSFCTELGTDPEKWSRNCPLPPPAFLEVSLNYFIKSYELVLKGQKDDAVAVLQKTRSDELREWYIEHGSYSGHKHRVNLLKKPLPEKYTGKLDVKKQYTPMQQREIYQRDNYTCRYCETKLIDKRILEKMEKIIGIENFKSTGDTDAERHGLIFYIQPTVDHVIPRSYGGLTDLYNGVTSCWNCNIGKYDALLYQMEIEDPRNRPAINQNSWDGLMSTLWATT